MKRGGLLCKTGDKDPTLQHRNPLRHHKRKKKGKTTQTIGKEEGLLGTLLKGGNSFSTEEQPIRATGKNSDRVQGNRSPETDESCKKRNQEAAARDAKERRVSANIDEKKKQV